MCGRPAPLHRAFLPMHTPHGYPGTTVRRDLLTVAAGIAVAAFASVYFELSEAVQSWTQRWERYQLDEFPGIALFAALAVAWFVWRRIREVRAELGRRVALDARPPTLPKCRARRPR